MAALTPSADSYIRLQLPALACESFVHKFSYADESFLEELNDQALGVSDAGFTEWQSECLNGNGAVISLGFAWFRPAGNSPQLFVAEDPVRSNVMLLDAKGYDLGPQATANLLRSWLTQFPWQSEVAKTLS